MEYKLDQLAKIATGKTIPQSRLLDHPDDAAALIPYLRSYVDFGPVTPNPQRWVERQIIEPVDQGGIVIASTGRLCVLNRLDCPAGVSGHVISVQVKSKDALPEWIRIILRNKVSDLFRSCAEGSSQRITPARIGQISLLIPSVDQQKQDLDGCLRRELVWLQKLKDAKEARTDAASVFLSMFGAKQSDHADSTQFVSLKTLASVSVGQRLTDLKVDANQDLVPAVIELSDDDILAIPTLRKVPAQPGQERFSLKSGDLLLARCVDHQVRGVVCNQDLEGAVFSENLIRVRPTSGLLDPVFLLACIKNADATSFKQDIAVARRKRKILIRRLNTFLIRLVAMELQLQFRQKYEAALNVYQESLKEAGLANFELTGSIQSIIQREELLALVNSNR